MENIWDSWIGLPHEVGADPRNGKAACCLMMAQAIYEDAKLRFPTYRVPELLDLARREKWYELRHAFSAETDRLEEIESLALSLFENGSFGLGLGIVVGPRVILIPHHRVGVVCVPVNALPKLTYHRPK